MRFRSTAGNRNKSSKCKEPGETGLTMVELAMSMFVTSIVVLGTSTFMVNMMRWSEQTTQTASLIDQARVAIEGIDRQVTSALVIYDPSTEGANAGSNADGTAIPPGFSLRVYTESDGLYLCDQWRVLDTGALQERHWQPDWTIGMPTTAWATAAQGFTNTSSDPPFVLSTDSGFGGSGSSGDVNSGRLLNVNLVAAGQRISLGPVDLQSAVDGRDVGYLAPQASACDSIPPS